MGLVTEALFDLLRRQIELHGTVVWYDPQHSYLDVARRLPAVAATKLAGADVHRYEPERGFFWLRKQLEPVWAGPISPPRLLIYVPLLQDDTQEALIEFEVAGATLRPGQQPPEQNTALAAVARQALAPSLPAAALEKVVAQVEAGQLSLAELDDLAERRVQVQTGAIAVIFGTGNATEVALRFLADPSLDEKIKARQAADSLSTMLSDALGMPFPVEQGAAGLRALRAQLARQVLVTDLAEAAGDSLPQALRTFPLAPQPVARQAAAQIAREWRQRRDMAAGYAEWAQRVQAEIGLGGMALGIDVLARSETFPRGEEQLQQEVEEALVRRPTPALLDLASARLIGFWSSQRPEIKTRWQVIVAAGRVLAEAARVESELKGKAWPAAALLSAYAYAKSPPRGGDGASASGSGARPWCDLDTAQRHLERDFHRFDVEPQRHLSLVKLVALARQRYAAIADRLAEMFVRAYADEGFALRDVLLQADVYREAVAPALHTERTAYLLVDALRFEMARDLLAILQAGPGAEQHEAWSYELSPALATPPAITEVGMAALLPGAEGGLALAPAGGNHLAAIVAGQTLKTRQERMAYLQAAAGSTVAVVKLDQLAPLSEPHLGKALQEARLIVVTATEEIDGLCENNPAMARRMLDDVFNQLRRGLKTLFGLGVQRAVITADHGYLFGEELSPGQKIDPPGGKTAALKRRVWVGQGGADLPGVLRRPLSAFGLGGDLELATPLNLSCFKVKGGGTEYFHGGLSLPELVIPVLTVRPGAAPTAGEAAAVEWLLTPGSSAISTRFLSVTVEGHGTQLLPLDPPAVRVEVRAGTQPISVPVSASYGFQEATKDVQLALKEGEMPARIVPNTVAILITEEPKVDTVTIHLLDAGTGLSLARLEGVPFAIAL